MRSGAALLLALPFGLACAPAGDADPPSRAALPIIGGAPDVDDPNVVGLVNQSGQLACTGTLLAPQVVLTAAHCLELEAPTSVFFGSDPMVDGRLLPVDSFAKHPEFDLLALANDVGVVRLAAPAPAGAEPAELAAAPPPMGTPVRFVGFGYTEVGPGGDYGKKRHVTTAVTLVTATTFGYGVATCNGDSGGPAFVSEGGREVLAGVTSSGDSTCASFGLDTRVDVHAGWIAEQLDGGGDDGCCLAAPGRPSRSSLILFVITLAVAGVVRRLRRAGAAKLLRSRE